MSAVDSTNLRDFLRIKEDDDSHRRSLSGLTLDAVLSNKRPELPSRTLLDIIRDEDPRGGSYKGIKEKRTWKSFRDRLRLKRGCSAWTSSLSIPTSDIPIQNNNRPLQFSRRSSVRYETVSGASNESTQEMTQPDDTPAENTEAPAPSPAPSARPQISRRLSTRMVSFAPTQSDDSPENSPAAESPARNFRPQISRHNSTRFGSTTSDPTLIETSVAEDESEPPRGSSRRLSAALAEERAMSAREVVADQEAEEAAAEEEEEEAETPEAVAEVAQPVRMSLMDLLEETDRQMGFVGSRYTMGDEDFDEEEDEEEEEEEEEAGSVEYNCCVCMVRHKGAAFIPCGHTFCRLCSRELWVQRGNCPLCNGFILEILDIF